MFIHMYAKLGKVLYDYYLYTVFFLPLPSFFFHKNMLLGLIYVDMNSSSLFTVVQGCRYILVKYTEIQEEIQEIQ